MILKCFTGDEGVDTRAIKEELKRFFSKEQVFNAGKSYKDMRPFSYYDELLSLDYEYPGRKSLYVEYRHIEEFNKEIAEELIQHPVEWLQAATAAISDMDFVQHEMPDVTVRVINLPDIYQIPISNLRNNHLEQFMSVLCVVSKASEVKTTFSEAAWQCAYCGHVTLVPQSNDSELLVEPFACENETCGKTKHFSLRKRESKTYNSQRLKVQEPLENLRGRQPKYLYVICSDELADIVKPGERIIITGILNGRTHVTKEGKTKSLDNLFEANSITKSEKDFENIEITPKEIEFFNQLSQDPNLVDMLVSSIAPSVFGMTDIKTGLALQLFSGVRRVKNDGTIIRGDIHILMVGDPGVAKSILGHFIIQFAPKGMEVSGGSASAAGLIAATVRDEFDGKWSVEGGALVMADGGVIFIDEFDKVGAKDQAALHTAMEQQFVDVAKAGVFAHMSTVCAVLAAANPKYGRYDQYEPIAEQCNITSPALLGRFDLKYVICDKADEKYDTDLASFILDDEEEGTAIPVIDLELMRKFVAYARMTCKPKLSPEAKKSLTNFYVKTRQAGGGKDNIAVTVRVLESARRMATAFAKMRLSPIVSLADANAAITLLLKNLRAVGVDPETGALDAALMEVGVSGSQRHRIKIIRDSIETLCKNNLAHGTASKKELEIMCKEKGVKDAMPLLKQMLSRGDILAATENTFKLIR